MSVDLHDTDLMESVNRFRNTGAETAGRIALP